LFCRYLVMIELLNLGSRRSCPPTPLNRGVPRRFEFRDFAVCQPVYKRKKM
jgi:hypothetical protein